MNIGVNLANASTRFYMNACWWEATLGVGCTHRQKAKIPDEADKTTNLPMRSLPHIVDLITKRYRVIIEENGYSVDTSQCNFRKETSDLRTNTSQRYIIIHSTAMGKQRRENGLTRIAR